MSEQQKFSNGDHIMIAKDLGPTMSHFTSDCEAIVIGSYADQFGGNDIKSYTLYLKGEGQSAWYEEHQLTLIEKNRLDLLEQWKKERDDEIKIKSNIDWIFNHGEEVIDHPHDASIKTLASYLGCNNLWGDRGEGFVYYQNALMTMTIAKPFLSTNNKQGYLEACKEFKQHN